MNVKTIYYLALSYEFSTGEVNVYMSKDKNQNDIVDNSYRFRSITEDPVNWENLISGM